MMKKLAITAVICLVLFTGIAKGQVFALQALDGGEAKIHVLPEDSHDRLTVWYLTDTLHFTPTRGPIIETKVLNKTFLMITYMVHAGSDINMVQTVLLCVNHQKLCAALHITSIFQEAFTDWRKDDRTHLIDKKHVYEAKLDLTATAPYQLNVKIFESEWSKHQPKTNYKRQQTARLNFDTAKNIFYNGNIALEQYFKFYDPKTQKETRRYIKGTFPVIRLGSMTYCYIKGEWYDKDKWSKYSYR